MFDQNKNQFGDVTHPLHLVTDTWDEHTKRLEDNVRERMAFSGKWQTYIDDGRLKIPDEYLDYFKGGGVVTIGSSNYLMLFGSTHWALYQRWLAHKLRFEPDNRQIRNVYRAAYEFQPPDGQGFISIDPLLARYAGLNKEVALIGLVYYFEVHNKASYLNLQRVPRRNKLMDFIGFLKHNNKGNNKPQKE